jgi:hypothetical protein
MSAGAASVEAAAGHAREHATAPAFTKAEGRLPKADGH